MPLRSLFLAAVIGLPILSGLLGFPVAAQDQGETAVLPDLSGPVILTVRGLDPARFEGGVVELDIGRLASMGESEIETTTIWTEGSHVYTGVLLADLLRALDPDATGQAVQLLALNDYAVDLPVAEVTEEAPLLAYMTNGEPMPVRDKGPIWVIYPYDSSEDYRTDMVFSRSVWQLDRITLLR
jgi:hypothetical protein